ncbi:methionine synthase [Planktothrix sp. FACHB-1355]|uniref:Methionine synthase n=1 Tax=Aerosakkonema funiforme FACHB-1375 TaxID=2949571 RepID=A0A926ZFB2_9CYAN|nr:MULTISPECIES: Npun_R2821/Npun_R2822 family protein [Oscillatoriales]MBD2180665.1 methionine synthase [Aerosakkonema funiforme FACHB-1375]MBD3558979.1 methionine synthase [Planktothrix sp. FACHB-1355]
MARGIYIVANEKVSENAIALLNSIRYYDPDISVYLIPFNDNYQNLAATLNRLHNVQIFPDLDFLNQFTQKIAEIFERDFLALPNKMRKLVAWFGPLDEFLYIDTDIIVFEKIAKILDYLSEYGFICNDYHHAGRGLQDIFSPLVREEKIFTEAQLSDVFNSGFWASKKGTITLERMYELLRECSQHREYFDFSSQVTDQPILNYIVLNSIPKRFNLVKIPGGGPGSWAGSKHFQQKDIVLYDGEKKLQYLHWAGIPMKPGAPYRGLWEYYRYLNEPKPTETSTVEPKKITFWQRIINKTKSLF